MKKKPQNDQTLNQIASSLREHAQTLHSIPTGEQHMGGRDVVLHSALQRLAGALDLVESELVNARATRRGR